MRGFSSRATDALMEASESSQLLLQKQTSQPNGDCPLSYPVDSGGGDSGCGGDDRGAPPPPQRTALLANGASRSGAIGSSAATDDAAAAGGEGRRGYASASADDDALPASCCEAGLPYGVARCRNTTVAGDGGFAATCGCCDRLSGGGGARSHGSAAAATDGPGSLVLTRLLNIGAKLSNDRKQESAAARELLGDCRNGAAAAAGGGSLRWPRCVLDSPTASCVGAGAGVAPPAAAAATTSA